MDVVTRANVTMDYVTMANVTMDVVTRANVTMDVVSMANVIMDVVTRANVTMDYVTMANDLNVTQAQKAKESGDEPAATRFIAFALNFPFSFFVIRRQPPV